MCGLTIAAAEFFRRSGVLDTWILRCGPSDDGREPTVREAVEGRPEGPALVHQKSAVPEEPLRCCGEPQRQNDNGQTPREVPL